MWRPRGVGRCGRRTWMGLHESDISWQVLRGIVHDWAGSSAELAEVKPLAGGSISNTLLLKTKDGARAVLKISSHRVDLSYRDEAHQLSLLRDAGLPVPDVYRVEIGSLDHPHSFILIQYVDGVNLAHAKQQCAPPAYDDLQAELGDLVARMHAQTGPAFQRLTVSKQPTPYDNWPTFFRDVYDPIWLEAEKNAHLPVKVRKRLARLHERLDRLVAHDDAPRLVHWDLWSSNVLATPDAAGKWRVAAIIDPNGKYGHCEAEIAYLELFHTVTPAFMKAYQHHRKLSPEYHHTRKHIYQVYPLIEHVNLFGHEYVKPLCDTLDRLSAVV